MVKSFDFEKNLLNLKKSKVNQNNETNSITNSKPWRDILDKIRNFVKYKQHVYDEINY